MQSSTPAAGNVAEHPFNDTTTADVVLRSCDQVDFYTHKLFLSFASPFFKDMFRLQQPEPSTGTTASGVEPPIVDVPESSKVLDPLLRFCYPVRRTQLSTCQEVDEVIGVALKYEMDLAIQELKRQLLDLRSLYPSQVFAVACHREMEDVAAAAAATWRTMSKTYKNAMSFPTQWKDTLPVEIYVSDFASYVSAGEYLRLIHFILTGKAPASFSGNNRPIPSSDLTFEGYPTPVTEKNADVILRSVDRNEFHAHSHSISLASDVLSSMINDSLNHRAPGADELDGIPVVEIPEDRATLDVLLRLCYPMGEPSIPDLSFDSTLGLLSLAIRYKLPHALEIGRRRISKHIAAHLVRVYFLAAKYKWAQEARQAAVHLARCTQPDSIFLPAEYPSEMEQASSETCFGLLEFIHQYHRLVFSCNSSSYHTFECWPNARPILNSTNGEFGFYAPEGSFVGMMMADKGGRGYYGGDIIGQYHKFFENEGANVMEAVGKLQLNLSGSQTI